MHEEKRTAARRRRPKWIWLAAALLVLVLLTVAALRVRSWNAQRQEARVLVLVNAWNSADTAGFTPQLKEVEGWKVDRSCASALRDMLADCRAAGYDARLSAAYRSREEQMRLFDAEMLRLQGQGLDADAAWEQAARSVGLPGASEHELGLAVDIEGEGARAWLAENAWQYGFILRYGEGSEAVTGMDANPAHFRYVGQAAAGQIVSLQLTLEEYLEMFFSESAQIIFED